MSTIAGALRPAGWHRCGAYGSGGARVIATSADLGSAALVTDAGEAFVLDLPALHARGRFVHGLGRVTFAALSPDGATLATVEDPAGQVALWNVATGALEHVMTRPPAPLPFYDIGGAAFSPDGTRLAVGSSAGLTEYDVATGATVPLAADPAFMGSVLGVAYVDGGSRLLLVENGWYGNGPYVGGGNAYLVDAADGGNRVELAYAPYHQAPYVPAFAVSRNGHVIALGVDAGGGPAIGLFDAHTGAALPVAEVTSQPLAVSDDGATLATLADGAGGRVVEIHQASDGAVVHSLPVAATRRIVMTADLARVLEGDAPPHVLRAVQLDGTSDGVACGNGHGTPAVAVAQTPDGATLVEDTEDASGNTTRSAWDVATGAPASVPGGPLDQPSGVFPDGASEVRADPDNFAPQFERVDRQTGAVIRTFGPQPTHPDVFDVSPDGTLVASSARRDPVDRRGQAFVKLWDAAAGTLVADLETSVEAAGLFHGNDEVFVPTAGTVMRWCH
ncbi:MAG TPA: hypothetical protein VHE35_27510 [Kofleriaceae bacterium]|nr:hypothetical protein [Kofleriaceae bacterium]